MSRNDITGDLIVSKGTNQEEYNKGWDAIFGKKVKEPSAETLEMFAKIEQGDWSVEAALEAYGITGFGDGDDN